MVDVDEFFGGWFVRCGVDWRVVPWFLYVRVRAGIIRSRWRSSKGEKGLCMAARRKWLMYSVEFVLLVTSMHNLP